ncbi:hypothetical protein M413DRAFT_408828 [Hebeloma cylindrosporum]|uniref:CCHC-type domain-containing protein n=1 Tax=Hebeloma cylindrosporum TaxID=76867 RepID=A0A0C3CF07_HEBCY|nr:hypothetical protein M413DRAFT_408828 [Hebeloma cylindrosporum h7]
MSTSTNPMHPYSLRARISKMEAKIAPATASIPDQEISDPNDPSPVPRRLFSDVVSGNNKTLQFQGDHDLASNISAEEDNLQDLGTTRRSDDQEDQTPDQNLNRWTVNNPNTLRKSRSLSSLGSAVETAKHKAVKSVPAKDLVAAAEKMLTAAQKDRIERRNNKVAQARNPSIVSLGEGPSKMKGKGVDPLNWGNANLSEEDLDPEAQQAALDSLNPTLNKKPAKARVNDKIKTRSNEELGLSPARQIPLDSYIGQTLNNIHRLGINKRRSGDDPSSSSSSSSSESNKDSEPGEDSEGDLPNHSRAYNRFVTEGTTYVIDGRVPRNRRVFVLSYYLDGVAYDFYTQRVSMNFEEWTLQEFFEELYNYCFPVNYRMEQRLKLKRCFQNDKKVSAYVHELEELYNMIGAVDEREKVIKLWYGLRASIQQGLWRDLLNPETSTWEQVADHASILEIAHNVSENKDRRQSNESKVKVPNPSGNTRPGNSNRKTRTFPPSRSGSQPFHRASSERFQPPRNNGRFSSQRPSGSNNRFGSRAPSNGSSSSRFTPKPFEKPKPNLSDKEKSELLASGKCFNCKEAGHLARNCPKGNTVRSSSTRPPGVPNFNIELEALEEESSDEVQILDTLQASVINIRPQDIPIEGRQIPAFATDWDQYDPSAPRQTCLGAAWAKVAEEALFLAQPLPGDSAWITRDPLQHRFYVVKEHGPFYAIYDRHQLRRAEIHEEYL